MHKGVEEHMIATFITLSHVPCTCQDVLRKFSGRCLAPVLYGMFHSVRKGLFLTSLLAWVT